MLARQAVSVVQLGCALEMLLSQLSHAKVLQSAPNHPVEKWIIGCDLVGLQLMATGLFDFA